VKKTRDRKKIETKLRSPEMTLDVDFPDLDASAKKDLEDTLNGKVVGRDICHT